MKSLLELFLKPREHEQSLLTHFSAREKGQWLEQPRTRVNVSQSALLE
jgi:hypothetical protein